MARPPGSKAEIELLQVGIDLRSVDKSAGASWVQNTLFRGGRLEVRQGFGTLGRYSCTMPAGKLANIQPDPFSETPGYLEMLGACWLQTDDGHQQILTLHTAKVFTANLVGTQSRAIGPGQLAQVYCLNVYDITSDTRQEFILYRSTSDVEQEDITSLFPIFQTEWFADRQSWVYGKPTTCSFVQSGDRVFMTLAGVGAWVYQPVIPTEVGQAGREGVPQYVDTLHSSSSGRRTQGETCAVQQLKASPGEFEVDGIVYLRPSEFPTPTCAAAFNNRLAWCSGRTVLFSNPDRPNVIQSDNFIVVPTERDITAAVQQQDRLIIFTDDETWVYQPPVESGTISGGRLICLAYGTGCLSPNHVVKINELVVMVDRRGTYLIHGMQVEKLSDPVEAWWTLPEQAQNPYSNFVTQLGFTPWDGEQPRARIDIAGQLQYGKLTWSDYYGTLFLTLADVTLCLMPSAKNPTWQVWLYESASVLEAGVPVVGLVRRINQPWLLAGENDLYLVSTEDTTYSQESPSRTVVDRHLHIAQYGRGGALDVSSSSQEDRRQPLGQHITSSNTPTLVSMLSLERPIPQPIPFRTSNQTTQEQVWLVPVSLQSDVAAGSFHLRFLFDSTKWALLLSGLGTGRIDYLVPPERLLGRDGYANTPGVSEVALYDFGTGLRSNSGNMIRIYWDGSLCPGFSQIGAGLERSTPVLYLPFVRAVGSEADNVLTLGAFGFQASVNGLTVATSWWAESRSYPEDSLQNDALAQPVDWAIKTRQLMLDDNQLKYRGMWLRMLSHGQAVTRIPGNAWVYGVLNSLVSADYQDFSGQVVNSAPPSGGERGNSTIARIQPLRNRMQPPNNPALFRRVGAQQARWGTNTDAALGNFLVDDPQVDTIATSDSVRGEQFSIMAFGSMANPGERMYIGSLKGTVQVVGGKRRGGRTGTA